MRTFTFPRTDKGCRMAFAYLEYKGKWDYRMAQTYCEDYLYYADWLIERHG
jgi:hypothetical protein